MPDHRVPLLGDSWRRIPDPERSRDPRVQLVLAGLRDLSAGPAPEPAFRAELRAQLVAITPRIVAEGDTAPVLPRRAARPVARTVTAGGTPVAAAAGGSGGRFHLSVSGAAVRRVAAASTCAVVAMAVLLGVALYLSRNTVPGDALYGLKRASENFQLATDSSSEKSSDLLKFAGRRVDEAQVLASRGQASAAGGGPQAAAAINGTTSKQIQSALASADSDVRQVARLLGDQAVDSASAQPLTKLTSWAPTQVSRLKTLWSTVGTSSTASPMISQSLALVTSAKDRAEQLGAKVDCGCLRSAPSDALGPKPCVQCSQGKSGGASVTPAKTHQVAVPGGSAVHTGTGDPAHSGPGLLVPSSTPTSEGKPGRTTAPVIPPVTLPSVSVPPILGINSCGVHVSLGGLNLNVGGCPSS